MYECRNIKHLFKLILVDIMVFLLCACFFFVGKSFFNSSAGGDSDKPVFMPVIMYHSVYVNGIGILPEKPVMITLDDGCYNNLSDVLPLLEKYDMHAIVSVVGEYTNVTAKNDPHISA